MTLSELASQILLELIPKSGVREWEETESRANLVNAALEMAAGILLYSGEVMANEIYIYHGTEIVFGSEVGDDVAWSSESVANGAGRQSSFYDWGADGTARPWWCRYRIYVQAQATPTVGNLFETYLKTSDGTNPDNDDGASDAAVSAADKLKNLDPLKSPMVDEAAANVQFVRRGVVRIPERYFGVAGWNAMGSTTTADASETKAVFTQIYPQQQA